MVYRSAFQQETVKNRDKQFIRFLVVFCFIAVLFTFFAIVSVYAGSDGPEEASSSAKPANTVSVEQGDTLWSIAAINKPQHQDIRLYIEEIKKLNGMKSSMLREGQSLQLP
ncbi:LysM peptidoglycan-binding domain-containing protein [Paenibacillus thalictri]|uniref:LysM peptidoglycan-binding domain-containing protein n=1 Tax=Paenibacillus thalictri TaxID=2527873 RepID=A0A4Q9DVB5_9BACL|nr:LysM peptidoglycan-binding domain-containing protein [Paenibacillus thalictri]TBL80214.1 LysM peptidoglycan-binding domain-containing protein [Paenibacillus thalictri]